MLRLLLVLLFFLPLGAEAARVSFATAPLWVSQVRVSAGRSVIISTAVMKNGDDAIRGTVAFYADGKQVGSADFSLEGAQSGAIVSISWVPPMGEHHVSAKITETGNAGKELAATAASAAVSVQVLPDIDGDGIPDTDDPDDDNDGRSDAEEKRAGTNPLLSDTSQVGVVQGVSTSSPAELFEEARGAAEKAGRSLFDYTEGMRAKGGSYADKALADWKPRTSAASSTEMLGTWWNGFKFYGLTVLSFFFKNIHVFYIVLIFAALWLIRKIWRHHSLD